MITHLCELWHYTKIILEMYKYNVKTARALMHITVLGFESVVSVSDSVLIHQITMQQQGGRDRAQMLKTSVTSPAS